MQCPKCDGAMEVATYVDVKVDRCNECKGIWFKPGSARKLKEFWMSEFIDEGDPKLGKKLNKLENVKCPECGTELDKVLDKKQTHIEYETCPNGHGTFFDAGEFTDWKYDTMMDRFRDLLAKVR